jgi:hypothetical protein
VKRVPQILAHISVNGVPELINALRRELATHLLDATKDQPPAVADRLRSIVASFDAVLEAASVREDWAPLLEAGDWVDLVGHDKVLVVTEQLKWSINRSVGVIREIRRKNGETWKSTRLSR